MDYKSNLQTRDGMARLAGGFTRSNHHNKADDEAALP